MTTPREAMVRARDALNDALAWMDADRGHVGAVDMDEFGRVRLPAVEAMFAAAGMEPWADWYFVLDALPLATTEQQRHNITVNCKSSNWTQYLPHLWTALPGGGWSVNQDVAPRTAAYPHLTLAEVYAQFAARIAERAADRRGPAVDAGGRITGP